MSISLFVNEKQGFNSQSGIENNAIHNKQSRLSWDQETLDYLQAKSWACARVCELKPELMRSAWGNLQLKDRPDIIEQLTPVLNNLKDIYCEGQKTANLYGGAIAIRYINKDTDWASPINLNQVQNVSYSRVFDKWEIYPDISVSNINNDPKNPEFYRYNFVYNNSPQIDRIHCSRIIRFRGSSLSAKALIENDYWENSLLERFIEPYLEYYNGKKNINLALKSFSLPVIKKKGLIELFSQEFARGTQSIRHRLKEIFSDLSSNRGVALDSDSEEINFIDRKFQGLKDVIDSLQNEMVAASGLTKPQMLKEHPNGLSATGESERLAESLELLALQDTLWGKLIREDLSLLLAQFNIYDGWDWRWNSSYQNNPTEDIKIKETQSIIDERYYNMGTYNELEIRESRFSGSSYNPDLILNDTLFTKNNMTSNNKLPIQENVDEDKKNGKKIEKFIPPDTTLLPTSFYDEALENLENVEEENEK
jgi:phage-related protein (TIGR01555 family)